MLGKKTTKNNRRVRFIYLIIGLLIFGVILSVIIMFLPNIKLENAQIGQKSNMTDAEIASNQIGHQCAIGNITEEQKAVSTSLGTYLSGLSAGSKVTTSDIGAIVEKITPTDQGVAFYKIYTECLKQQSAILLAQKGINLAPPDQIDIESKKDEQIRREMSEMGPDVPKSRLVQLLGAPIASNVRQHMEGTGLSADFYQYKYMLFVVDYYKSGKRVALVISTKDPMSGTAMFMDQIKGVTVKDAAEGCQGVDGTAHGNAKSGICPASHASNYIKKIFFFQSILTTGESSDKDEKCSGMVFSGRKFGVKNDNQLQKCSGAASAPAFGIAIAYDNPTTDRYFVKAAEAWLDALDFGGTFTWRSDAEENIIQTRNDAEEKMNEDQLEEYDKKSRADRVKKMQNTITTFP